MSITVDLSLVLHIDILDKRNWYHRYMCVSIISLSFFSISLSFSLSFLEKGKFCDDVNLSHEKKKRKLKCEGQLKRSRIIESLYCHTPSLASGVSFIRYMILDTVTNALYLIVSWSPAANSVNEVISSLHIPPRGRYSIINREMKTERFASYGIFILLDFFDGVESEKGEE